MTLKELRDKRNKLKAEIDAIIAASDKDGEGILTDEQGAQLDALESQWASIDRTIKARERAESREQAASTVAPRRTAEADGVIASSIEILGEREDPTGGFQSIAHFAQDVRNAQLGRRTTESFTNYRGQIGAVASTYHNEAVGVDGGYLVPPQYREEIWDYIWNEQGLLGRFRPEPTSSNVVELLRDETTPWASAGVRAYWRDEGAAMTPTKTVTEPTTVRLNELYAFTNATQELLDDAPRLADRLTRKAAQAIQYKLLQGILDGTGAGQPLGILQWGGLVSQAKEGSQTAATINANNIAKMVGRQVDPSATSSQVWIIHPDAINQILTLTIGNQPVWTPVNAGMKDAPMGLLLGRAVYTSDFCATLGTVNDIILADTNGYYLTQKAGIKADTSIHLYFDQNLTAFRWTMRAGGRPYLSSSISPKNGSSTRSHFVVLATRA